MSVPVPKMRPNKMERRTRAHQRLPIRHSIPPEFAIEALSRSGYLLETRIAKKLDQFASHLSVNVVFADPETGQSRELDAYCFRAETGKSHEFFTASAHVLIECVNNPQPIAFFSNGLATHAYPLTAARPRWLGFYPLERTIGIEDFHHCCKGGVVSNYCTFVEKKSGEWMATHADEQHKEFATLAMLAEMTRGKQLQILEEYSRPQDAIEFCGVELIYPVLVAEGALFKVAQDTKRRVQLTNVDHITYLKRQMWKGIRRYCPIDVITEKFLPRFLRMIETESKRTLSRLEKRADEILAAVKEKQQAGTDSNDPLEDFLP
jgi:hypothetical protein